MSFIVSRQCITRNSQDQIPIAFLIFRLLSDREQSVFVLLSWAQNDHFALQYIQRDSVTHTTLLCLEEEEAAAAVAVAVAVGHFGRAQFSLKFIGVPVLPWVEKERQNNRFPFYGPLVKSGRRKDASSSSAVVVASKLSRIGETLVMARAGLFFGSGPAGRKSSLAGSS